MLMGFIRPERKFDSFDELVSTIRSDIDTARSELDCLPYSAMRRAPWLAGKLIHTAGAEATYELLAPAEMHDASSASDADLGPPPPPGFVWGRIH
mmetsp:Transcript_11873/g.34937  ORF Transcript_11873/g.34937 Transcript_11873/m.34937 type:complete len:95 (+) Transcript_11873:367-651(+)